MRDVLAGLVDDLQILAGRVGQTRLGGQQQFGVGDNGRQGVVDVMGYATGHLAQGPQAFLLDHDLLRAAQFIVGLLHTLGQAHLVIQAATLFLGGEDFDL